MQAFTYRVIAIIQQIPEGRVMTYGQIARLAGSPRAARQVVRILHSCSQNYQLPWHRVINAKGEIALKEEEQVFLQKTLLESEGLHFTTANAIDLTDYQYHPKST
ncbi:6-O-methylguanine DNA methyltransferase [Pullulanibacillus camelliae]|uniref:6-O-methylguanine DNA methyltransferase n=1 Tax=Pullulanibacillus camelliae TaxID=1707096 RepID=A0A8J2VM87_9BACL|nr:MGMT family protein [Pullulanibacillus camelliae]GGE30703.1 6-O-methylguanine DNA methyltransferase [Pullulanibacillus camelliae]